MERNEQKHILTLTFVTLTSNYTENNDMYLILGVLYPSHQHNTWFTCELPNMQNFAYFDPELFDLDLDSRSHGIIYIMSNLLSVILQKNKLYFCAYNLSCWRKCQKLYFDDHWPVPTVPNIYRLCKLPIFYYNIEYPRSNRAQKAWATDIQTYIHTDRQTEPIILQLPTSLGATIIKISRHNNDGHND